jgi:hypothetical protein
MNTTFSIRRRKGDSHTYRKGSYHNPCRASKRSALALPLCCSNVQRCSCEATRKSAGESGLRGGGSNTQC